MRTLQSPHFCFYLFITFVWLDKIIALILYYPSSCHTKPLVLLVVFWRNGHLVG